MSVFAVIAVPPKNLEKLGESIARSFDNSFLKLSDDSWLISATGTPQEVAEKLGIVGGAVGSALIVGVGGYFGRANPNVWSWLKTKMEQSASDR